ncbi:MAG: uracil-DNA glycosylase [Asticcacaulis sp.]
MSPPEDLHDDLHSEIESYLGFLIDHELDDTYETRPLNRTLAENKPAFQAKAASAQIHVLPTPAPAAAPTFRPQALAGMDAGTLLHEARQRAHAARSLDELYAELEAFQNMPLRHEGGKGLVHFRGPADPELLVIGESPDEDDDAAGLAFSGKAGDLINTALTHAGVMDKALLAPCVFWRPAGGRPLTPEDISLNAPFVHALIKLAAPKAILLLGASAVSCTLNLDQSLAKLRGRMISYGDDKELPVMASYPPGFLLKRPQAKGLFWHDLLQLMVTLKL